MYNGDDKIMNTDNLGEFIMKDHNDENDNIIHQTTVNNNYDACITNNIYTIRISESQNSQKDV